MSGLGHWWKRLTHILRRGSQNALKTTVVSTQPKRHSFEFLEDRSLLATGITASYLLNQDWGSGFQGQIELHNDQSSNVSDWTLEFDFAANITSIWDAKVVSHVDNHYVVTSAGWNKTLSAGGNVAFGFVATPGDGSGRPTNLKLNGVPLDDGNPGPSPLPSLSISDTVIPEGNSGQASAAFTLRLSAASSTPVTVQFATSDITAQKDSDYEQSSGTLTFSPGEIEKSLAIKVIGDGLAESDETFRINLFNASGATLADSEGVGMIQNDDIASPPAGDFQFRVLQNWGSGFTGEITARNSGSTSVEDWRIELDYGGNISTIWNASVESHTGNHYVIKAPSWNKVIAAGATITFGFTATPGNAAPPTNFILRSTGDTGLGGGPNRDPAASHDQVLTTTDQPALINVLANDTDSDGDLLSVTSYTQATHGIVTTSSNGSLIYTPAAGFVGSDFFTYVVADGRGGTATSTVSITVSGRSEWPEQVFAPYVDMTLYPMFDLVTAASSSGARYFTLAFIVADSAKRPSWGGYSEYVVGQGELDAAIRSQLAVLRGMGGDAMVSFGGAANQELAQAITDIAALKNAYQSVIDAYGLRVIDFDIEGAAAADRASIDRRSQAIAALQRDAAAAGRSLEVHFTLPVLPTGLTNDGLYVLQSAIRFGVDISVVNIMAMDYGDSAAPNPQGRMGDYAIQAATSLFAQLRGLYGMTKTEAQVWGMIGVTPMIGLNDVVTETFDQHEARELLAFAEEKGLAMLSMWSLNRDRANPNGPISYVEPTSSSIAQSPLEFSILFNEFLG